MAAEGFAHDLITTGFTATSTADDRASVAEFVGSWTEQLDLLITNAAIMEVPERELSAEGSEVQFATNHLGHFALAIGLHDALATAGSAATATGAGTTVATGQPSV